MHFEAARFLFNIKKRVPEFFDNKIVLDVGGGNNTHLFTDCIYISNDVIHAPNVNLVCRTKDIPLSTRFDTIVSSECFEHDPQYKESLSRIMQLLKPGGLFAFTCASTGRAEHGTSRTNGNHSYGTLANIEDMKDYYKNLTMEDIMEVIDINSFSDCEFTFNPNSYDLYFYGIKNT